MTREEEIAYNTNPTDEDSDNDGYKDGVEIINLYSPLLTGDLLINSGLVTTFRNNNFNYSILYPSTWAAETLDEGLTEVVFLPNSETGEFISVLTFANTEGLTLTQWGEQVNDSTWVGFTLGKKQQLSALQTTDGTSVLFVDANYAYVVSYNIDINTALNFTTTFDMVLNSFELTN